MEASSLLKQLQDIDETLRYETVQTGKWDSIPKVMQLDIKEAIDNLRTAVYAGFGYAEIHPKEWKK